MICHSCSRTLRVEEVRTVGAGYVLCGTCRAGAEKNRRGTIQKALWERWTVGEGYEQCRPGYFIYVDGKGGAVVATFERDNEVPIDKEVLEYLVRLHNKGLESGPTLEQRVRQLLLRVINTPITQLDSSRDRSLKTAFIDVSLHVSNSDRAIEDDSAAINTLVTLITRDWDGGAG